MIQNLSKSELLRLMRAYDKYIKDFFDDEVHNGMIPVCLDEFYDNEYSCYIEVGEVVKFGKFVDDEDLSDWLDKQAKKGIFEFKVIDTEDDIFWVENCPYGIWLTDNWYRDNIKDDTNDNDLENPYLKNKFIQEFRADRVIDDIMDFCNNKELNHYIITEFRENCDLGEFRDIFDDLDDEEFIDFMNNTMGFEFEDIEDYNKKI